MKNHKGITAVGGSSGDRGIHDSCGSHRKDLFVHLPGPRAVEHRHIPSAGVQIQLCAHKPLHGDRRLSAVHKTASPADHVAVRPNSIDQLQGQVPVFQRDHQFLRLRSAGPGQRFHGSFFLPDQCVRKQKIRCSGPVLINDLHKGIPDISLAPGGHLQPDILQIHEFMV